MRDVGLQLVLIAALVGLNAAFSGSELALLSLRRGELERLEQRGGVGRVLARLTREPNRYLAAIQLGVTLTGFLASAVAAVTLAGLLAERLAFLGDAAGAVAVVLITVALTLVTLVAGELVPKRLALQHPLGWALVMGRPVDAVARLAAPAIWVLSRLTNALVRILGGDPTRTRQDTTEQEIADLVGSGLFGQAHRQIITGALEVGQRTLREVFVPRPDVLALPEDLEPGDAVRRLVAAGHSRAPVYRMSIDDADRVVSVLSLAGRRGRVADHCRPALVLPETLDVVEGLRRLQASRRQLALVVDEYGGLEGIVTVEDLVEELVGEIYDEHDPRAEDVLHTADGGIELHGRYPVHELAELGVPLTGGESATIGGLVTELLARLPEPGDTVTVDGWQLTVLSMHRRAVGRLRIEPGVRTASPHDPREPRSAR